MAHPGGLAGRIRSLTAAIAGAGGHNLIGREATDPRIIWQATQMPGALSLTLVGGGVGNAAAIEWEFRDVAGDVVTDGGVPGIGSVDCDGPTPDTQPPTAPGRLSGSSTTPGTIDLSWTARATIVRWPSNTSSIATDSRARSGAS